MTPPNVSSSSAIRARALAKPQLVTHPLAYTWPLLLAALLFFAFNRPAEAMQIQTVKSPGGIEAWLVEDHSNPMTVSYTHLTLPTNREV